METTPKKSGNLTNEDFRELINNHLPIKREHPQEETRKVTKENKDKKIKGKKYDKRKREDHLEQLLSRYRDRAKERREGKNPDYLCTTDPLSDPMAYHAVGPDIKYNIKLAERRRQLIQESKYLGGDMAHTHLVKGLDYALLNKVRSEIEAKTKEDVPVEKKVEEDTGYKSQMAKNIHEILFKSQPTTKNPLFAPGKMSYLVDLLEEEVETDVPTTVIRSRILTTDDGKTMITTDAIIENIRQVMQGVKGESRYKRLRKVEPLTDIQEEKKEEKKPEPLKVKTSKAEAMLKKLTAEPTGYAECYPGQEAMLEAADDSDCEATPLAQESGPRAAYQFGLKKAAGRKTRQSEKVQKASLDREWAMIRSRLQI